MNAMRSRAVALVFVLGGLVASLAVGIGVYASAGSAEVFGLAATPSPSPAPPPSSTTTSTPSTTTTTRPKVVTDEIAPDVKAALLADNEVLKPGTSSPAVLALEKRLHQLRYDVDEPDATYDEGTTYAVMAFQKVNDLDRDGLAGPNTRKALAETTKKIEPLAPKDAPASRFEVDMTQQVVRLYMDGELTRVIATSTGSGQWFTVEEELRVSIAVTNPGVFEITRKYPDWEKGPLGELYKPMYFDGGIAIHGYPSVPPFPASHGCVRIPMATQDWLFKVIPTGFPVYVFGKSPEPETEKPPTPTRPPETDTAPGAVTDTAPSETPSGTTTTTTEPPPPSTQAAVTDTAEATAPTEPTE